MRRTAVNQPWTSEIHSSPQILRFIARKVGVEVSGCSSVKVNWSRLVNPTGVYFRTTEKSRLKLSEIVVIANVAVQ